MSKEILLFDLPSKGKCACWSLNPWKTRLALNYKSLPYKTQWIEYPDIAPTFQGYGIPPNLEESNAAYSIPAVQMPDGRYIMESRSIADALEKLQPAPSLHLDNGYVDRTQQAVTKTLQTLAPLAIPRIPEQILNDASQSYFRETRAKRFGMPLEALAKSGKAGENAWKAAQPSMDELKVILHENDDGPYIMGAQVSYADFVLAGLWAFVKKLGEDDIFKRGLEYDDAFPKHYQACEKWLARDDH